MQTGLKNEDASANAAAGNTVGRSCMQILEIKYSTQLHHPAFQVAKTSKEKHSAGQSPCALVTGSKTALKVPAVPLVLTIQKDIVVPNRQWEDICLIKGNRQEILAPR